MSRIKLVVLALALSVLVTVGLVGLGPSRPAEATCGSLSDKSITGTLTGEDGHAVNAVVGFTFVDLFGYRLDARGCRYPGDAYGRAVQLNATLPATGALPGPDTNSAFRIDHIPSNVHVVWVESYPKGPDGKTDYSHYSGVYRPDVLPGTQNVRLSFPTTCAAGGTGGAISAQWYYKGVRTTPDWAGMWSESNLSPQMGYSLAKGSNGGFTSFSLASAPGSDGQPQLYQVQIYYHGQMFRHWSVPVHRCQTTYTRFDDR